MPTKTLPAFMHDSIGTKTHGSRAAQKHMLYIMREEAMTKFQSEHMANGERGTSTYFDKLWEKAGMPNNHRIADQFIIALPLELDAAQRHELVHGFMESLGKGRIAWCAAHHDEGKDAHNPHVHILFKDADIDTGRKVIGTTVSAHDVREAKENGWKVPPRMTTKDMRHAWCDHLNHFMEREGIDIRYDARTYKQRGIDREPGIHIGPKANALTKRNHDFRSRDLQRQEQQGQETIPYSQLDQGSRADHNAKIAEENRRKELEAEHRQQRQQEAEAKAQEGEAHRKEAFQRMMSGMAASDREGQEKRELRDAHKQARQAMYAEQQRDREALKTAQKAEKDQQGLWAQELYAKARETAYQSVKEQHAERWKDVRAIGERDQRQKAEAALKEEQKLAYKHATDATIAATRPEKDKAWKAMQETQDKQRLDLRAQHRDEASALAKQHIAEQLAVHEKWRAHALDKQAQRIETRLSNRQGMVAQQQAAQATLRLREAARQTKSAGGPVAVPANPHEAERHFTDVAKGEQQKQTDLRGVLTAGRNAHIARAAAAGPFNTQQHSRGGRPRRSERSGIMLPGEQAHDTQTQVRQAAQSGRTLTDAERTNAPPDVKERLASKDRKEVERSLFDQAHDARQKPDKGRQGGGRGR